MASEFTFVKIASHVASLVGAKKKKQSKVKNLVIIVKISQVALTSSSAINYFLAIIDK